MPHLDFYAVGADVRAVVDFLFRDGDFEVYPLASPPGQTLSPFVDAAAVMRAYGDGTGARPLLLQLYSRSTRGTVVSELVALGQRRSRGAEWRHDARGWGLIQLYVGGAHRGRLASSHTNHLTEAAANRWESTSRLLLGPVSAWDWGAVTRASNRLNGHVRSLAVHRIGGRPVLPVAFAGHEDGTIPLAPLP